MGNPSFDNSPTTTGQKTPIIETGVIANVNVRNWTADWVSQYSGKHIPDLQWMTPYIHYNNGEGFSCVPEVGAICTVCFPSDGDPPFIMGFLSGPENEAAESGDLTQKVEDPDVESEEDLDPAQQTSAGGSTTWPPNPSDASFRAARPILNPGDMLWQGRDENFVVLRRGGVLQLGSTNICQRAYIPLLNFIRDFCENYELTTAAGTMAWRVERQEDDPSGNAPTNFSLIAREFAQDEKASIRVSVGALEDSEKPPDGDKTVIEVVIAPQLIAPDSGEVTGDPVYVIRLDKVGNTYMMQAKNRTVEVKGNDTLTVTGDQAITVKGNRNIAVEGNQDAAITGEHSIKGEKGSREEWSAMKTIKAAAIKIGSDGASEPAVLGLKLITWLASHSHPPYAPPIQAGQVATLISKKVFVE